MIFFLKKMNLKIIMFQHWKNKLINKKKVKKWKLQEKNEINKWKKQKFDNIKRIESKNF